MGAGSLPIVHYGEHKTSVRVDGRRPAEVEDEVVHRWLEAVADRGLRGQIRFGADSWRVISPAEASRYEHMRGVAELVGALEAHGYTVASIASPHVPVAVQLEQPKPEHRWSRTLLGRFLRRD